VVAVADQVAAEVVVAVVAVTTVKAAAVEVKVVEEAAAMAVVAVDHHLTVAEAMAAKVVVTPLVVTVVAIVAEAAAAMAAVLAALGGSGTGGTGGEGTIGGGGIVDGKIIGCPEGGKCGGPPHPPRPPHCPLGSDCHGPGPHRPCPPFCRGDGHDDHDHVKVIHKTVVVHDRDNNPQTILLNTNTQTGTCFVSSQQVVDVPNLVTQLLNQCTSVTITP
jgi:hypothetical protein